jgi:tetratricopeptide (TPR) repeat protein
MLDRAIQLCLILRAGAGDRLNEIESIIIESLKNSSPEDGYLANWLADILLKHRLGGKERLTISRKLEELAIYFEDIGELHKARDYFDAASEWYKKAGDAEKSAAMIVKNAECWVKEAIARQSSDNPSNMVAASFYENAIHKYRTIPRVLRDQHNVESRITELRGLMNEAGEKSLHEMGQITSGPIDISKLIENAIKAVKGKELPEALLQFANIYRGARAKNIREFSEEMMRNHPLQSLFAATHLSSDGRVIAKRPAADLDGENKDAVVWPEMVKHYAMQLSLVVQGDILPALEVLRQEHRLKEADFYSIVARSPVVPPDRKRIIAKALFHGYDDDFVSSLHLLTPQIENLVRYHLKQHGEKTTNIDTNGIENENGLSALMDNPKVNDIFGEDLAFEIKALFCDAFGPNLRNELAHGLIGYEESQSIYSIYAWWLFFRLVFNTFWNTTLGKKQLNEETAEKDA